MEVLFFYVDDSVFVEDWYFFSADLHGTQDAVGTRHQVLHSHEVQSSFHTEPQTS